MKKYYINLTEQERSQIIHSLIDKKNALMAQGRYTDAVDEVILKMMKAKKKAFIPIAFIKSNFSKEITRQFSSSIAFSRR